MQADGVFLELLGLDSPKAAYLAGFFDGEGSIGSCVNVNGVHSSITITVTNKDPRVLAIFKASFGGNIYKNRAPLGSCLEWKAAGKQAATTLRAMLPFLILKKDRAELALAVISIVRLRNKQPVRQALIKQIHEINRQSNASLKV